MAEVTAGEVDLAPTHTYEPAVADPPPPGVTVEPLLVEELVLATAVGHRLAEGSGRLPVAELAGRPLIRAPARPPRRGVESALAAAGATPAVVCESPGYALVCALVSAGLGVAVVPEMVASLSSAPLAVRRLEPAEFRRTISDVHRGDRRGVDAARPAAERFRAGSGTLNRGGPPDTLCPVVSPGMSPGPVPPRATRSRPSCRPRPSGRP
ncbi:LysR family transcriptional regulator substrate-binding protein [Streptomyces sp. ISL-112]|nr:LysR family transcriptional regulator substrate-binding protein [Streptomyces sp. ISL-112]MBT2460768.1 LysR family transcriptional regulator substrate-binding protein [Streptomyces sp. ISL-63]